MLNDPWLKLAFSLLFIGGLALASVTLARSMNSSERLTAARRLQWIDAEGAAVSSGDKPECIGDPSFRTLAWGDALWESCLPTAGWPGGAYVELAPERGVAELSWVLPESLPLERTEGLEPGPGGRLAIAYRSADDSWLIVGLAGPSGWERPPEVVAPSPTVVLLGMSWRGEVLELVTAEAPSVDRPDGWNQPRVHTIGPSGPMGIRAIERASLCRPDWLRCGVQAALRQRGAAVWRFLVSSREPPTLWMAVETGLRQPVRHFDYPWDARSDLDLTATGVLVELSLRIRGVLTPEGEVETLPESAAADFAGWVHDYVVRDDRLARRHQFVLGEEALLLQRPDGSMIGVEPDNAQPRQLEVYRSRGPEVTAERPLGLMTPECQDLPAGSWLDRSDSGLWLVSQSGCVMAVGPDLRRSDPLGLAEHLRTRGSTCLECDAGGLVWSLAWILFGLPLCLAVAYAIVFASRRRHYRLTPLPLWPILTLAVLAYDIAAIVLARSVLPLLT